MTNFYDILNVSKEASDQEIKKSYRALSLQYHPDRNGGNPESTEKFKEVNEAYEVLSDPQKRKQYNMELQFGIGFGGSGDFSMDQEMSDINEIFSALFGGGGGAGKMSGFGPNVHVFHSSQGFPSSHIFEQMNKPPPLIKNIKVSLKDVYNGSTITIPITRNHSSGLIDTEDTEIHVTIPKGMNDGEVMILREQGHIYGSRQGDIKLIYTIEDSDGFERHGMNLIYKKTITLKESLCGFSFEIVHLNGKHLNIQNTSNPSVIKPNYRKNIPNYGMIKGEKTGMMTIEFSVDFPDTITGEQREILNNVL